MSELAYNFACGVRVLLVMVYVRSCGYHFVYPIPPHVFVLSLHVLSVLVCCKLLMTATLAFTFISICSFILCILLDLRIL